MHIIIETKQELIPIHSYRPYGQIVKAEPQNKAEKLQSGFTREELRQIVAEQID